jgi:hypothetical protein
LKSTVLPAKERHRLAVGVLEGDRRQSARLARGNHRGNLPLQQRRNSRGNILRCCAFGRCRFRVAIAIPGFLNVNRCRTGNDACDGRNPDELEGWQAQGRSRRHFILRDMRSSR